MASCAEAQGEQAHSSTSTSSSAVVLRQLSHIFQQDDEEELEVSLSVWLSCDVPLKCAGCKPSWPLQAATESVHNYKTNKALGARHSGNVACPNQLLLRTKCLLRCDKPAVTSQKA